MWKSQTKTDLIIEVWEKLDCESIGRAEIEAIEAVVGEIYGEKAVDPPMIVARLLADEGAELRHAEIMKLHVDSASKRPYAAALRNVLDLKDLRSTLASVRDLENLRRKYTRDDDKNGVKYSRETAIRGKNEALVAAKQSGDAVAAQVNTEIADWLTIWLQTPEMFETWVSMRQRSADFVGKFGHIRKFS